MYYYIVLTILLFICKNVQSGEYKPYDILMEGPKGSMFLSPSSLTLACKNYSSIPEAFSPPLNETLSVIQIVIYQCHPPITSYAEDLQAININTNELLNLNIVFNEPEPLPLRNYTLGLNLQMITFRRDNKQSTFNLFRNNPNFLEPLSNLTEMAGSTVELPFIPQTVHLENLTLYEGSSIREWGNCRSLKRLSITSWGGGKYPLWPDNCSSLISLDLNQLSPEMVQEIASSMVTGAASLLSFSATYCRLYSIPNELLFVAKNLTHLDLSDNYLYHTSLSNMPDMNHLTSLDLSSNKLTGMGLETFLIHLPALQELNLNYNTDFHRYCDAKDGEKDFKDSLKYIENTKIEILYLTEIDLMSCLSGIHFSNVRYISLMGTVTTELKVRYLPKTNASELLLDFDKLDFVSITFEEQDYEELRQKNISLNKGHNETHLKINMGPISCDCKNLYLVRALRDFPNLLSMEDLRCNEDYGTPVLEEPLTNIDCEKWGRNYCWFRLWKNGTVVAECEKNKLPVLEPPVHGLNVSGRGITVLHPNLPETLQWIDLRHNRISRADYASAAALFARGRRVWLSDNLIDCDCENKVLLDAIQEHSENVVDYESLTCVGSGTALSSISTAQLCQVPLRVSLAILGILVVLALSITLILRRYGEEIRMYMYAHGICLWCLRKKDLDDRPYDAFLSFAHGDDAFVQEKLLPGLENAPEQFKVCVHYRDWLVGDWIPAQIIRSIREAKRTLIVLSRNFVLSTWSALEFRYAVAHAAQENRMRLIVIVLDDVLETELDAELQGYLAFNTYLRCDDPWFWEKLRYAMPHRSEKRMIKTRKEMHARFNKETNMDSGHIMMEYPQCHEDLLNN